MTGRLASVEQANASKYGRAITLRIGIESEHNVPRSADWKTLEYPVAT